jgi:hypothetical protein
MEGGMKVRSFWSTIGRYGMVVVVLVNILVGWYWGFPMAVAFGAGSILGSTVTAGKVIKVLEDTMSRALGGKHGS